MATTANALPAAIAGTTKERRDRGVMIHSPSGAHCWHRPRAKSLIQPPGARQRRGNAPRGTSHLRDLEGGPREKLLDRHLSVDKALLVRVLRERLDVAQIFLHAVFPEII